MQTISIVGRGVYNGSAAVYNGRVPYDLSIGDILRIARRRRRLSQTALGRKAREFPLGGRVDVISRNTVAKAENDPWSSELATIWRLLGAAGLTFAEVERLVRPWPATTTTAERDRAVVKEIADTVPLRLPTGSATHEKRQPVRKTKSR